MRITLLQCCGDTCPKDGLPVDYRACTEGKRRPGMVSFGPPTQKACDFFAGDEDAFLHMPCRHPNARQSSGPDRAETWAALSAPYRR